MSRIKSAQDAVDMIPTKSLRSVKVGDVIKSKPEGKKSVVFTVSSIKRGQRGYAVSLRTTEGYEWIITGVRWALNELG